MNEQFAQLMSLLLSSSIQAQIFHRQTKSFSEHNTLNTYYDEVVEIIDGLTESFQGKYGIIGKYGSYSYVDYTSNENTINYFVAICGKITDLRKGFPDTYIQNQIDSLEELIYSTLYKLRNLK